VGVVVFDSDVLIGFLSRRDRHHADAIAWMERALAPGTRRMLCAVNYSEILIGPLKVGRQEPVKRMLAQFSIEIVDVDRSLAERAAAVRAGTALKLPDAYAVAVALQAEERVSGDVALASFDTAVVRAHVRQRQQVT
jgi:predicted nucleic acid-binding protein